MAQKSSSEARVREIRRQTRRRFSAEEKIRIVLERLSLANSRVRSVFSGKQQGKSNRALRSRSMYSRQYSKVSA